MAVAGAERTTSLPGTKVSRTTIVPAAAGAAVRRNAIRATSARRSTARRFCAQNRPLSNNRASAWALASVMSFAVTSSPQLRQRCGNLHVRRPLELHGRSRHPSSGTACTTPDRRSGRLGTAACADERGARTDEGEQDERCDDRRDHGPRRRAAQDDATVPPGACFVGAADVKTCLTSCFETENAGVA